ncbi:hypothetical protein G6F31_020570 [Rhizopus arrhizus]|nr:hypothetical protein G6F31_020570 [Rhizopus arrhizus]
MAHPPPSPALRPPPARAANAQRAPCPAAVWPPVFSPVYAPPDEAICPLAIAEVSLAIAEVSQRKGCQTGYQLRAARLLGSTP